ncbi:MAG: class I SAM-dependent rRNA methyltransferase [Chloroflexi bacterium]|nr:class I SAM-dependent rRNA methyltransferase [Chloroflexota bacterium]
MVDRYADVAIVHADSQAAVTRWLPEVQDGLVGVCPSAYVKVHPRGLGRLSEQERRGLAPALPAWGPACDEMSVVEHGVQYVVRPSAGLSVGLFLDMREVRAWLRDVCAGRSVLNLFAYTCSLGVCAALGGASRVVNVDVSRPYLEWGTANYALNGLGVDPQDFIYGDAFDWLHRFARRSVGFDLVIVDPPSFSSSPFSVTRDYVRLVAAAARVVARGGWLLAATNHAQTSEARFEGWLRDGLPLAGRRGEVVGRWHEPAEDFPVAAGDRPYLKVRAIELT